MKKFLLLATMVLGVVSCMKDQSFEANLVGDGNFVLSVALPDDATRAAGTDSAKGAVDNGVLGEYDVRYTLEVYDANGDLAKEAQHTVKATTTSFELRLIPGRHYRFVVWADFVKEGVDPYYNVADLTDVTLTGTHNAMNESRDAYTAVFNTAEDGDKQAFTSASTIAMTLTRPFAKLRVVTNDMNEIYSKLTEATVEYTTEVYTAFNALTAEAGKPEPITEKVAVLNNDAYKYTNETGTAKMTLFADYLFGTVDGTVKFSMDIKDESGYTIPTIQFNTNIPVERNHLTTIYGPILTDFNKVTVTIDDDFAQPEFEYIVEEDPATGVVSAVAKTVDGLVAIATDINNGELAANTNVSLGGDIDLSDNTYTRSLVSNWTPIGTSENPFTGTFDGRGYSIKNLVLVEDEAKEGKAYIGFFGYAKDATIKNVTFENVYINIPCLDIDHSQGHIGAVAGSLEGTSTIENVTVKGDIKVYATQDANGASRVAVIAGGNSNGNVTMKNVHVIANEGSYLTANNNTGALAGQLQGKMVFENCSSNINVTVNKFFAGGLVGIAAGDSTFTNCHTTGDVAVVAGREGRHNDEYRVGGIAGGWADGKTKVCTLVNCSYTGKVSGKNADGAVAEPLDYAGYVGRGYTLANCEGSKVVIDGTEYIQVGNAAPYGVYTVNVPVSTAEELKDALAKGNGVIFKNDITVAATKGGYNKAGILQDKAQTINGNGHTLKVTGAGATWDCAIYTNGGTIKNLTVAGAMRGVFTAGQSSDLNIENVVFKNVIYTFNSDGKMPAKPFGVYVSNSTVNGWTSHSDMHTEVVYTDCSFGEGSGYKYCRPYGKTAFVNCTFCPGFTIDKSKTTDLTFTNCTFEE